MIVGGEPFKEDGLYFGLVGSEVFLFGNLLFETSVLLSVKQEVPIRPCCFQQWTAFSFVYFMRGNISQFPNLL